MDVTDAEGGASAIAVTEAEYVPRVAWSTMLPSCCSVRRTRRIVPSSGPDSPSVRLSLFLAVTGRHPLTLRLHMQGCAVGLWHELPVTTGGAAHAERLGQPELRQEPARSSQDREPPFMAAAATLVLRDIPRWRPIQTLVRTVRALTLATSPWRGRQGVPQWWLGHRNTETLRALHTRRTKRSISVTAVCSGLTTAAGSSRAMAMRRHSV